MLTGKMVRVRFARNRIVPHYLDCEETYWQEVAERMLGLYRAQVGQTRGRLEEELRAAFGDDPSQLAQQGLAKLLEDRCEFEVVSRHSPAEIRATVLTLAAQQRQQVAELPTDFDRDAVLTEAAGKLEMTVEEIEQCLFADLRSEQRLQKLDDITVERLLQRYNVALAQAILLRASRVHVIIRNEPPQRFRQLLRQVKFHRLVCEVEKTGPESIALHLDGPLSLFTSTQKYGLQLALFLPAVLLCRDFEVKAEVLWGPQKKPKEFLLTPRDGLISHKADTGMYVPAELGMFVELFRKRIKKWDIVEESEIFALGKGFWVPDFRLVEKETGLTVLLEVLGFWRRSSAEKHLQMLRRHVKEPFLLAVSDQLHIEETELSELPAGIHRFRNMPLPDEVAKLANEIARPPE